MTCKKKTQHADERDRPDVQEKRRSFRRKVKRVEPKRLVFVDESGVTTAMTQAYGWAPRGERAVGSAPGSWESLTVIAALGLDGVRAPLVFPGSTDTAAFESYVEQVLVPELHAGDVVVWDNLSPHQAYAAAAAIRRAGARLLPLPPYSPDYTPIERLWSKVKAYLRRVAARNKDAVYEALGEAHRKGDHLGHHRLVPARAAVRNTWVNRSSHAIAYCLRQGGLTADELDYVAFYDKPLLKFERLLETYLSFAPVGLRSFLMAMPLWMKGKLHMRKTIRHGLPGPSKAPLLFMDHHESHAASAFFPSPFEEAAILTLDGVGEWSTTTYGTGRGNRITLTHHLQFPHSLGLLFSAFTYYCGFKVNSGEYKLMGLAPYGRPIYQDLIYKHLIDLKNDGSFWLNMGYFNYCQGLTMTNSRFHRMFAGPPRHPESAIEQRHMDLAASIQAVTEEIILRMGATCTVRLG